MVRVELVLVTFCGARRADSGSRCMIPNEARLISARRAKDMPPQLHLLCSNSPCLTYCGTISQTHRVGTAVTAPALMLTDSKLSTTHPAVNWCLSPAWGPKSPRFRRGFRTCDFAIWTLRPSPMSHVSLLSSSSGTSPLHAYDNPLGIRCLFSTSDQPIGGSFPSLASGRRPSF